MRLVLSNFQTALRSAAARRRAAVVVAAVFVWCYALGVLTYVLLTPEIGLRCAFTPVVNHFDEEFLYPRGQEPLRNRDEIVQVGNRPVANWSQLMRKIADLKTEPAEPVERAPLADLRDDKGTVAGKTS